MPAVWEKRDDRMHGATTQSWHDMALERAVDEFKETVCHVSEFQFDEKNFSQRPDPQAAAEAKLDSNHTQDPAQPTTMTDPSQAPPPSASSPTHPSQYQSKATPAIPRAILRFLIPPTFTPASITSLIQQSIHACDPDLRTQLYPNVVLTGANTILPGFADRVITSC
ncbi:actin family [Phlyctochytrium arcticum]|nr:actin family [Phlyctochytrium arcticum]